MYAAIKETVIFEIDNISILKRMFNKFFNESFEENQSEDLDEENSFEFFKRAEEILKQFSSSKLSEKTDSQSNKDKTIIAQILIDNGASIYDINHNNKAVLDYAIDFHNIGLMNLLYTMLGMEDKIIPEHEEVTPVEMSSSLILHDSITEIAKIGSKLKLQAAKDISEVDIFIARCAEWTKGVDKKTIQIPIYKEKYQSILDQNFMPPSADFYLERMWDKVF